MGECKVTVDSGVCKMITTINAKTNKEDMVELDIKSDCPYVLKMSWAIKPVFAFLVVEAPMCETDIYQLASKNLAHTACPVPAGILKAIEVAGDLGIKRDAYIKIE